MLVCNSNWSSSVHAVKAPQCSVIVHSYSEQEVAQEVSALRAILSQKSRPVDPSTSETHMLAEATEVKKQQLRNAFGIREDYVEGSAFSQEAQALRAAQEKAEREERAE